MSRVDFAAMLSRHRRRAALTQRELAVKAGLGPTAVRDFEQRRSRHPRVQSVRAIAAALGLPPDEADALQRAAQAGATPGRTVTAGEWPPHADAPLSVGVLGPLLVHRGAERIDLGAGRHRVVLARFALAPGAPVEPYELVELLWGPRPPVSSGNLLQGVVSQLRRSLQRHRTEQLVRLLPGGYRLDVAADLADVAAFRAITARARAGVDDTAVTMNLLGEALDLWRGEPVADVPDLHGSPLVRALVEEHIDATLRYADAGAQAGRWSDVLARVGSVAVHHPLHEPLHARLAVALAATGRQADALHTLQRIRDRLGDELGIDPGPEIADAQRTVLRQEWRRPANVNPPAADAFVGRVRELAQAVDLVRRPAARPAVVVLTGPVGSGTSTLLRRVAATLQDDFPDGVAHVDLRPAGRTALTAAETLTSVLRAFGVDCAAAPAEQLAQYRQLLTHRRVLVLLDNVREAAQIRAVLPAEGGSAALISSRRRLGELPGAAAVAVGPLAPAESLQLLAAVAGQAWSAVPRTGAEALAAACGHLPLALRGAANRIAGRTAPTVNALVDRLADPDRLLDALSDQEPIAAHLRPDTANLPAGGALAFRMLALVPGPAFGLDAAAATLGVDRPTAEEHLAVLVDTSLVDCAPQGRYRYASLVRRHARRLGARTDTTAARAAAAERYYDWLLRQVAVAVYLTCPDTVRLPADLPTVTPFVGVGVALAWLDAELPHIVEAVTEAAALGVPAAAWRLADQLRGYFQLRDTPQPRLTTALAGHAAARAAGDTLGLAATHQCLGDALLSTGQHGEALDSYLAGARHAVDAGWVQGETNLWRGAATVQAHLGRPAAAEASLQTALHLSDRYRLTRLRALIVAERDAVAPTPTAR